MRWVRQGDIALFYVLHRRMRSMPMDLIMRAITQMGSTVFAVLLPVLCLVSRKAEAVSIGINVGLTLIISQIMVQLAKRIVNRPRPYRVLPGVLALRPPSCRYSFPSGHTCAAFSAALVLGNFIPGFATVFYSAATLVAVSRVYLGFHYPSDVIGGFVLTYASFVLNLALFM